MNKLRDAINVQEIEWLQTILKAHNQYIASCFHIYYAHKLALATSPRNYLSIMLGKMDKSKTSITRLSKIDKAIINS